jgi:hypothetical protein
VPALAGPVMNYMQPPMESGPARWAFLLDTRKMCEMVTRAHANHHVIEFHKECIMAGASISLSHVQGASGWSKLTGTHSFKMCACLGPPLSSRLSLQPRRALFFLQLHLFHDLLYRFRN